MGSGEEECVTKCIKWKKEKEQKWEWGEGVC